jgi:hypothetical protein
MIKCFATNKLVLNLDKTSVMKFITNYLWYSTLHIGYKGKYVEQTVNTEFLGLQIYNHLNRMNYTEQIISKLSGAYYAVSSIIIISNINILKWIYYAFTIPL